MKSPLAKNGQKNTQIQVANLKNQIDENNATLSINNDLNKTTNRLDNSRISRNQIFPSTIIPNISPLIDNQNSTGSVAINSSENIIIKKKSINDNISLDESLANNSNNTDNKSTTNNTTNNTKQSATTGNNSISNNNDNSNVNSKDDGVTQSTSGEILTSDEQIIAEINRLQLILDNRSKADSSWWNAPEIPEYDDHRQISFGTKVILAAEKAKPTNYQVGVKSQLSLVPVVQGIPSMVMNNNGVEGNALFFNKLRLSVGANYWGLFHTIEDLSAFFG